MHKHEHEHARNVHPVLHVASKVVIIALTGRQPTANEIAILESAWQDSGEQVRESMSCDMCFWALTSARRSTCDLCYMRSAVVTTQHPLTDAMANWVQRKREWIQYNTCWGFAKRCGKMFNDFAIVVELS